MADGAVAATDSKFKQTKVVALAFEAKFNLDLMGSGYLGRFHTVVAIFSSRDKRRGVYASCSRDGFGTTSGT